MADKREHHNDGWKACKGLQNHCVAIAFSRAMADDGGDIDEVKEWFPLVAEELRSTGRLTEDGSWWGPPDQAAERLGLDFEVLREELDRDKVQEVHQYRYDRWDPVRQYRYRDGFPTMAQWCRKHPEVQEAVIWATGHAGYMVRDEDGVAHVYDMGARKRVDRAVVLKGGQDA